MFLVVPVPAHPTGWKYVNHQANEFQWEPGKVTRKQRRYGQVLFGTLFAICSMLAAQTQRWSQQNLTLEQELDGSTGKPHGSDMSRSHRVDYLNCSHNELAMS